MVGQPQVVLLDEASQTTSLALCSLLQLLVGLAKLALFGDLKQLEPFAHEYMRDVDSALRAIVKRYNNSDLCPHLRISHVTLNHSRRMPKDLTRWISARRYDCQLLDKDGNEFFAFPGNIRHESYLRVFSFSFSKATIEAEVKGQQNKIEAEFVVDAAIQLLTRRKSFHIITFYSSQRSLIERLLRERIVGYPPFRRGDADGLTFTVDSYQGKENDYILLSTVCDQSAPSPRTVEGTEDTLPFVLNSERQTVALTRCKKGMLIFTNPNFLLEAGFKDTLVSSLCDDTNVFADPHRKEMYEHIEQLLITTDD